MKKPIYKYLMTGIAGMLFLSFGLNAQNCLMSCKDTVVIGLDINCQAIVNSDQLYINPSDCPGAGIVHIFDYQGNDLGNTINGQFLDSILNVLVIGFPGPQYSCSSKILIKDISGPEIICKDTLINCFQYDKLNPKTLSYPLIYDNCSGLDTIYYLDKTYNFSCDGKGFTGYFALNWELENTCQGDGKIEINPENAIIYGANNTLNPPAGNCINSMKIKLPTNGKIAFNWLVKGLADKDDEALYCRINQQVWKLSSKDTATGLFTTPELKSNDEFSFEMHSNGDSIFNSAIISDFTFSSNIKEVIFRNWTAIDKRANESNHLQKISIESIDLNNIVFPTDFDGISNKVIPCGADYSIFITGQPEYINPLITSTNKINLLKFNYCIEVDYTDKKDTICGGSFKLTRTWKIHNKCKSILLTHEQIIIIEDKQPPVIYPPKEIIYYTDVDKCSGTIIIPSVNVIDQCSPLNVQVNLSTSFGKTGFGPFSEIPVGDYLLYYTATDQCGNSSQTSSKISMRDKTPPIVNTKSDLAYNLPMSGQIKIYAKDLDMGSTDNCCIIGYRIKRVTDPVSFFNEELIFNCNDGVNSPIAVTFRVYDCYGNYTDAIVFIKLLDIIPPVVSCPKDITISCTQDLSNLNLYGKISYTDNCQDMVQYSDNMNLNTCGEGYITRLWKVVDKSGNSGYCVQNISVIHNQYWNQTGINITWPLDFTTSECKNIDDLMPAFLAPLYKQPMLNGNTSCSNITVDFIDKIISNSAFGCISIERNWTIIEYCLYEATKGKEGIWLHKQILNINENQKPILTVPPDITVQTQNGECFAMVNLTKATAADCDPNPLLSNSSNGIGGDISGKYNVGVNLVTITATDHCGNVSSSIVKITVKDNVEPIALCKQNANIDLDGIALGGFKTILPSQINDNSFDNCTAMNQLKYTLLPDKINCNDIGNKLIVLEIKDQYNNSSTCSTLIKITDVAGACQSPSYLIKGSIKTELNKAIAKVSCKISGGLNNQIINNTDGTYSFDQLTKYENFAIEPKKDLLDLNGVTTYDLILLNNHLLGKKLLDSPYKYIAADVNNSKKVTLADYVIIKDLLLLNIDHFPKTDSWRFVPSNYKFGSYQSVLPAFPEQLDFKSLQSDIKNADFIGIKMGDLNNSNTAANLIKHDLRSTTPIEIIIKDTIINKGEFFSIPVKIENRKQITGFQFSLDFEKILAKEINLKLSKNSILNLNDIGNHINTFNSLLVSWVNKQELISLTNDTIFTISGIANTSFSIKDFIKLGIRLEAEAYTPENEIVEIELLWKRTDEEQEIKIKNTYPNPFKDFIKFNIESKVAQKIYVKLYNIQGQLLKSKSIDIEEGFQEIEISTKDIEQNGQYILNIIVKDKVLSKKLFKFALD